jgi:iron complex transport system ATP-binding protein
MLLQFSGLSLKRGFNILENIHWVMEPGQNWVILGSNGSGKTSLLNIILGYQQPSSGRFMVFGHPFGSVQWEDIRKQIGIVSQSIGQRILPEQIAQDIVISGKNAQLNTWNQFSDEEIDEAKRWLFLFGIEHLSERKWDILSQGERQRVLISRALILQPKLLILDEPCAGLDPIAREGFLELLQYTLTEEFNVPTILVTHHVEEILPMFTHVLLMKAGQIVDRWTKDNMLLSSKLTHTFGSEVVIQPIAERYNLHIVRRK